MLASRNAFLAAALLLGLTPSAALAHNMTVVAEVLAEQTDRVRVRAFFDDETFATDAVVRVSDAEGREVATGKLDDKGVWTFPRPKPGAYTIRVEYIGHDREVVLTLPDEISQSRAASGEPNIVLGVLLGLGLLLGLVLWSRWRRRSRAAGNHTDSVV